MSFIKKIKVTAISTVLAALAVVFSGVLSVFAFAEDTAGFNDEKGFVFPAKTPYDKSSVEIMWHTAEGETVGVPLCDAEYAYLPTLNKVRKIDGKGNFTATAELSEKVSENYSGALCGGILIVPARTSLYKINTENMEILSEKTFGEISTNVGIIGNLVYFGIREDENYRFICADISDNFKQVWSFVCEEKITSPALFGRFVVFGAGGKLVVCDKATGESHENIITENDATITNVYAGKYAVFMTCSDGALRKVRLESEGSAEEDSLEELTLGKGLTAMAEFNNRVYLGSEDGFFIVDGLNMELIKKYPELKNSCAPVVCYGSGQRVYTAAPHLDEGRDVWYLYGILDTEEEQSVFEIAKILDFENGRIAVSVSGIMYFRDAEGALWAIQIPKNNIFLSILKIVLTLAIIVLAVATISALAKRRTRKTPPKL